MNCCDDWGQCTQGHGCPVRRSACECAGHVRAPDTSTPTPIEQIFNWLVIATATSMTVALVAGIAGYLAVRFAGQ